MSMEKYSHKTIEEKWKKVWQENNLYKTSESLDKSKFYVLDMFPYPSGAGLHVGHPKGFIATDIFGRLKTMQGFNVLHPMGWDAFGLPAENYALKNKVHPRISTGENIATYKRQLGMLGFSYDWEREIDTTDPEFYKWTQWIFLKMFERGLAFESYEPINWCPGCLTGLANEDLEDGKCERCGSEIEQKPMRQWVLKITDYADRMLADLDKLPNWDSSIKEMQRGWIGRSEGAEVDFEVKSKMADVKKVYLGTGNKAKLERFKHIFKYVNPDIEVEQVPEVIDVPEVVDNGLENSKQKVLAYKGKYEYPVISGDTSAFFEGEDFDPTHVKRVALAGEDESKLTQEQIAEKIKDFYINIAKKYGGKKEFYYLDSWSILFPDGEIKQLEYKREYIMTDKVQGKLDINFPMRSLHLVKATGKYPFEETEEEWISEFKNQIDSFESVFGKNKIKIYTTRVDTIFSCTYLILAPEHKMVKEITTIENKENVELYIKNAAKKSDMERTELAKEKTGVFTGSYVINPATNEKIPVWISDFVLAGYGTGAVFADAHDERDFVMAKKYNIPLKVSIRPEDEELWQKVKNLEECFSDDGTLVNSGQFDDLSSAEARVKIIEWLENNKFGNKAVKYKLKDWVFSRQRYWGEPIPIIHCEKCGAVGVPEKDLPVRLPEVEHYEPSGTGESPLATIPDWVNTTCPKCGGVGKRETNTMPQWAGSSWYYLRFIDPKNNDALVDKTKEKYWSPVDFYVGGAEHATRHLIYARFWHKFLFDIGAVNYEEPFTRLQQVGLILASDGRKMSKRWGNVINPDDIVNEYGADAMRVYEMFMGPFSQACAWNTNGLVGVRKFLDRVWGLQEKIENDFDDNKEVISLLHKTIKKVGSDIEEFKLNTAVSAMMIMVNKFCEQEKISRDSFISFLKILSPFAPFISEELFAILDNKENISKQTWPTFNPELATDDTIQLNIQVNGKIRDTIEVGVDISEEEAKKLVFASEKVQKWVEGKEVLKVIYVKGRLVSIVVK